jgi:hypothetical protein
MNHLLQLTKIDANAQKKMDKLREDAVARVAMVQITLLLFISLNVQYCRSKVLVKREFSSLRIQKTKQTRESLKHYQKLKKKFLRQDKGYTKSSNDSNKTSKSRRSKSS